MQALRTECDAKSGSPIFPAALCSRFASGNVILFNRMEVRYLKQILEYRLKKCVSDLEQQFQIQVHLDDNISKALIFAEGGMADARTISGRGEKFLSEEIYELFQQIAFGIGQGQIDRLQKIYFSVDFKDAALEVRNLFQMTADMEKSVRDVYKRQEELYREISCRVFCSHQFRNHAGQRFRKFYAKGMFAEIRRIDP